MWRTRKCAEGRSPLRRWRAVSRTGCRDSDDIWCVSDGSWTFGGGSTGLGKDKSLLLMASKLGRSELGAAIALCAGGIVQREDPRDFLILAMK